MSAGAEHRTPSRLAHGGAVESLMKSGGAPSLMRRWQKIDFDNDIPFGSGYNVDGTVVYLDRDLVRALFDPDYAQQLVGHEIDTGMTPHDAVGCLWRHEQVEKVLSDSDNHITSYEAAHDYASAAEHDMVRQQGSTPVKYEAALKPLFAYCARKTLKQVPKDLSAAPALDEPAILAKLKAAGVEDADKVSKQSVNYGKGHGDEQCSRCTMWMGQDNSPLAPCSLVEGLVRDTFLCDKFAAQDHEQGEAAPTRPPASPNADTPATSPTPPANANFPGEKNVLPSGAHAQPAAEENSQNGEFRDVLIARHGATALNNEDNSVDRIRSHKDIPLSSEGISEAKRLAAKIAADPPDVIVTSDLRRAADTAKIIAKACGLPVSEITQGLRPWKLGYVTGMLTSQAIPIMARYIEHPDERVPAGHGEPEGQSFHEFLDTYFDTVLSLLEKYPGRVLFVAHHRNERAMHAWEAKGFPPDGSVDTTIFNKKGEAPGTVCPMKIPVEALEQFERKSGQKSPASSNTSAVKSKDGPIMDHHAHANWRDSRRSARLQRPVQHGAVPGAGVGVPPVGAAAVQGDGPQRR
jgi:broad specificity phosphatase PhoE